MTEPASTPAPTVNSASEPMPHRGRAPAITALPDGHLRIFEPDTQAGDRSRMYVLDVLGLNVLLYVNNDSATFVHIDHSDSWQDYQHPLLIEVFNGGENQYGQETAEISEESAEEKG